jgi:hypothetical protein
MPNPMQFQPNAKSNLLDLKSEARHAALILLNHRLAVIVGGIVGFREQHAVVTSALFDFAHAAGLNGIHMLDRIRLEMWVSVI